jgi:glucose/arabinose dehydrogenase
MGKKWMKRTAFMMVVAVPLVVLVSLVVYRNSTDNQANNNQAAQPVEYRLVEVANGFSRPLYVTHAGDGSGRLFVVEQSGAIKIIEDGAVLATPFLDVSGLISQSALGGGYTEQGLLGLAFAPDYVETGVFYINYTDRDGNSVIARYRVSANNPNMANADSADQLLYVQQPYRNHNGGQMAFGPDGYLYTSFGDGGSAGDPQGNGQNLGTLLGTILRLDVSMGENYAVPDDNPFVNSNSARPEIWAWGLRNVWRFSFDRVTGDLYLADVGQNQWEEINFQPANSPGGENYGWNAYEGSHVYSGLEPASEVVWPVLEYGHSGGACSVTGGYVYRGEMVPGLQGYYLYGDWCTGTIWAALPKSGGEWSATVSLESGRQISSFGEDEAGELYLVDYSGAVLRFGP